MGTCKSKINGVIGKLTPNYLIIVRFVWVTANFVQLVLFKNDGSIIVHFLYSFQLSFMGGLYSQDVEFMVTYRTCSYKLNPREIPRN